MNTKQNTQILKDGERTVIIIEGASKEQDEIAFKIISAYNALALGITCDDVTPTQNPTETKNEIVKVEGLEPLPETRTTSPSIGEIDKMEPYADIRARDNFLIPDGDYKGKTATEALQRDGELALVRLCEYIKRHKGSSECGEVIAICKQYMISLPYEVQKFTTRERKCNFLNTISHIAPISVIINGYANLKSFCEVASDEEIDIAVYNLAAALSERGYRDTNKK